MEKHFICPTDQNAVGYIVNRSKKTIWDIIDKRYREGDDPKVIIDDIISSKHFDPSIVPPLSTVYGWIHRKGLSQQRKKDQQELVKERENNQKLKHALKKRKFEAERDQLIKALTNNETSIDDLTIEKIAELKALANELVQTARDNKDFDQIEKGLRILDKITNTLLKARIIEDKPTEKTDTAQNEALSRLIEYVTKDLDKDQTDEHSR